MKPNALELFAGIGGMALGMERAGVRVVGLVELDPFCRTVLRGHWPEVATHDDVRTTLSWWVSQERPRVDIIAGGYPCQGESSAGNRAGTQDARWLWPDMARLIYALQPRYVIGENVVGHRTRGLPFVLRDLERLGYVARAGLISASALGAPHERKRIFVLADSIVDRQPRRRYVEESRGWIESAHRRIALANAHRARRQARQRLGPARATPLGTGRWATEPRVDRVAHGVPSRVDRGKALGNACVPQVAEYMTHLLLSGQWRSDG